jgi:hypothetical protein
LPYVFKLRGLAFSGLQVSFYIKPGDGFWLPDIMQWIKQMFAVRSQIRFADLRLEFCRRQNSRRRSI